MKLIYKQRMIISGILGVITTINFFILPNLISFPGCSYFLLIVVPIACLISFLINKEKNNKQKEQEEEREYINNYSFIKSKIDNLYHFNTPRQMADYFYKNLNFTPTADFVLRLAIFAYNYFDIDELEKEESKKYKCTRHFFYETFDNPNELKECIDVLSTFDAEQHVISYEQLSSFIWSLFGSSQAMETYRSIFDEKVIQERQSNPQQLS